ncbi:MAG: YbhB/YbcL family Raf kinase inhibitor-like protein [bacterium]
MKKKNIAIILVGFFVVNCSALILQCDAFKDKENIPVQFTCDGQNISPQLSWSDVPDKTKSFAIICDDPDAPMDRPFVHWVIFNIRGNVNELPENVIAKNFFTKKSKNGSLRLTKQGTNDFGKIGYGGACPPKGAGSHRYVFTLYALDTVLNLNAGINKSDLLKAIQNHILAETKLTGLFERK